MRISDWSSDVCSSDLAADVYSPCALGGTVNEQTLPRFKFKVICGSANNQLSTNAVGDEVAKRGILYAPDYAVNAGGVMNVALEITGYNRERAMRMMRTIYHNLTRIYEISERDGIRSEEHTSELQSLMRTSY